MKTEFLRSSQIFLGMEKLLINEFKQINSSKGTKDGHNIPVLPALGCVPFSASNKIPSHPFPKERSAVSLPLLSFDFFLSSQRVGS